GVVAALREITADRGAPRVVDDEGRRPESTGPRARLVEHLRREPAHPRDRTGVHARRIRVEREDAEVTPREGGQLLAADPERVSLEAHLFDERLEVVHPLVIRADGDLEAVGDQASEL